MYYPTKINSTLFTCLGFLMIILITFQIISGLILICFFDTNTLYTFNNLILYKLNYSYSWFIQSFHEINSNIIFLLLYLHVLKNINYSTTNYTNKFKWLTGFVLYILMIIICFLGYVLPWGQMSFWAATVITNLLSILPYGTKIINIIWGGLVVGNNTLIRFTVLHYLLPFILVAVIILHINFIHHQSTKKIKYINNINSLNYFALIYFIIKDLLLFI